MQTLPPSPPPRPPRTKALAFKALAVALPFVALLLIEGALRLAGVGEARRRPFVAVPGHETSVALDPDFGALFFRGFRPGAAFDPLDAEKEPGTLRVVALGGSTTAGFPYHWYYGFPARLEDRLAVMLPGRRVEVANLGLTATNSYTLWTLAEPVVEQRPDAVVIYAGQNEYYGAYGTGGTQGWTGTSIPLKRFVIGASRWALVSGLGSLVGGEADPGGGRTMMARVVRDAAISEGGETYRAGIAQYEANLRDALRTFERAGIPVFLATLVSNLADQAPLGDEPSAQEAYDRGRQLLARGDSAAARAAFLDAKEADGVRFRAPEAMNGVVRRLASEFPNVTLVDVQERFRQASPGGVEGASLFTDHLHPNARGYALMADAFAGAMRAELPALRDAPDPGPAPSGVDAVEAAVARLQIAVLTNGYPFRKDRTPAQAEAAARAVADSMARSGSTDALAVRVMVEGMPAEAALDDAVRQARAEGDTLAALRLYDGLLHWQPFNEPLIDRAVGYALQDPAYDAETAALARYAVTHTASPFSLNALAVVALRQGDLAQAGALLAAVERVAPASPEMLFNKARLLVVQGDTLGARAYFERYRAVAPR